MEQACDGESEDGKFTERSAMFEAIIGAISARIEEGMLEILKAVVRMFSPRLDLVELVRQVGSEDGGDMGEDMTAFFCEGV